MGTNWTDLPASVQSQLESALIATIGDCNDNDFANLLTVCSKLEYNWCKRKPIAKALFSTFVRLFSSNQRISLKFVSSIHQFGQSGMKWSDLPLEAKTTILSRFEKNRVLFNATFRVILSG
jgi:hypothetical protein